MPLALPKSRAEITAVQQDRKPEAGYWYDLGRRRSLYAVNGAAHAH